MQEDSLSHPKFSLVHGRLHYKGRLVLSSKSKLIPALLHTFHDSVVGGHSDFLPTYKRLTGELYWKGMKNDVKKYVEKCVTCQVNKSESVAPTGLLQPLPRPDKIWEDVSMDFIEGLPVSQGVDTIVVVVDRLSKYAHFISLKHPFSAKIVAAAFIKEIVRLHGFPRSIVSDCDKIFVSHFWNEIFRIQGTQLRRSTTFHPQTDGQTERVNHYLETYLRCYCNEPKKWVQWLAWAEFWYNATFHTSINTTPFNVVYGRQPPPLISYGDQKTTNDSLEQQLIDRDRQLLQLKEQLRLAQERMKKQADKKRRDVKLMEGDWAYLKIRPNRQKPVAKRQCEKLSPRFYGSYQVIKKVSPVAYKLELPSSTMIHDVFHISQLKKAVGQQLEVHNDLPPLSEDF